MKLLLGLTLEPPAHTPALYGIDRVALLEGLGVAVRVSHEPQNLAGEAVLVADREVSILARRELVEAVGKDVGVGRKAGALDELKRRRGWRWQLRERLLVLLLCRHLPLL